MKILENKVALITGAGRPKDAIGTAEDLKSTAAALSAQTLARVITMTCDVRSEEEIKQCVADTAEQFGQLDIVVNNAGIAPQDAASKTDLMIENVTKRMAGEIDQMSPMNYLRDLTDENWDRMIKVHLYGAFYGCRAALTHMQPQRSGRIINISSVLGLYPAAGAPHYSVAKAGIITLTKAVAAEVAPLGINVNAICPGYIRTPLLTPFSETMMAGITMRIGKGRLGEPDELADMIRFLSGPESEYCTGDVFNVSGGYTG